MEEAREIRARAVVMELPPRRAGTSLFGKTIETVLTERPCRVIIESTRGAKSRLGSVLSGTTMALCNAPTGHPRARSAR